MINELVLKTMYTDAIRNMVSSINESIKNRFKCKEKNWNSKNINYPYTGNLHEVSIEVKDITLREKPGEYLYPSATISIICTRKTHIGSTGEIITKTFPATTIEFNIVNGDHYIHDLLILECGFGYNQKLLKNIKKYNNIEEDIKKYLNENKQVPKKLLLIKRILEYEN